MPADGPIPVGEATLYVVERGWHTDIGISADEVSTPLASLGQGFPGVRFMVFGFGERAYYMGLIWERQGHAYHRQHGLSSNANSYHALRSAMEHYEQATALRPPGNDDAILRWNACARVLMKNPEIRPLPDPEFQPITGE